jgi:hypothetical protein
MFNQSNKNYLCILPSDVLSLIFEFEGIAKENYDKIIKEFQKILKTKKMYDLAFKIPEIYDDMFLMRVSCLHTTPIYKFILNQKKISSTCQCSEPCCFRFQYYNQTSYNCRCHEKKESGINYSYYLNRKEKISIIQQETGFCVKITKQKFHNLMSYSPPVTSQTYDENAW